MDQDQPNIESVIKRLISFYQEQEIVTSSKEKDSSWNKVKQRILQLENEKQEKDKK